MTNLPGNASADDHQEPDLLHDHGHDHGHDQINEHVIDSMTYRAEMGFTHHELLKGLPNAVVPYMVNRKDDLTYLMTANDRVVRLCLSPEKTRKIAAITLPVTDIVLEFENFTKVQHEEFIDRFRKYLHRGGG